MLNVSTCSFVIDFVVTVASFRLLATAYAEASSKVYPLHVPIMCVV